jgi:hypothetical protein
MCWAIRGMLLGPSKKLPSCRATPDRASGHRPGAAQHRHEQAHPGDRRASGRGGCRRPRTSKAARCSPLTRRWRSSAGWYSSSGPSRKPLPRSGADESRAPSAAHSPNPRRRCHRIRRRREVSMACRLMCQPGQRILSPSPSQCPDRPGRARFGNGTRRTAG